MISRFSEKYNTDTIPQRDVIRCTNGVYLTEKPFVERRFPIKDFGNDAVLSTLSYPELRAT